jgi:beta-N-acetylhexosaminidase
MKSLILFVLIATCLSAGFFFYLSQTKLTDLPLPPSTLKTETAPVPPEPSKPEIQLEEKVGSLFMVGHWAHTPVGSTTDLIRKYNLGGVIIMSAPDDVREILEWTKEWQAVASNTLLISIDQEGGPVTRLKGSQFTQRAQHELTTPAEAYALGKERGKELTKLGITMNFAPVLDSARNPDSFMYSRVFKDRARSATFANEMIRGMESQGVIAVAKHFPGHDDTDEDSHSVLPTVSISKEALDDFTLPFRELIKNGQPKALMTAHVLFPNIDTKPATLSSFFLNEYLRKTLGFNGVIITDDVSMDAIDTNYGLSSATVEALEAGADIILFAAEPEKVTEGIEAVNAAVTTGVLTKERITESYTRTIQLHNH